MKRLLGLPLLALLVLGVSAHGAAIPLSDGKTFSGWAGETNGIWRIVDGAFVGGSLKQKIPRNEFLRTTRSYTNFVLRLEFKLVGTGGFVNGGVQVRSSMVKNPANEMCGYQCDMGDGYWGALYDESRRNKILAKPAEDAVQQALRPNDWNRYEIRCEGRRIQTRLNGALMVDYTEADQQLPQYGLIGLQIHGGGPAEAAYREMTIEELF